MDKLGQAAKEIYDSIQKFSLVISEEEDRADRELMYLSPIREKLSKELREVESKMDRWIHRKAELSNLKRINSIKVSA